jgi:hypothetical protein
VFLVRSRRQPPPYVDGCISIPVLLSQRRRSQILNQCLSDTGVQVTAASSCPFAAAGCRCHSPGHERQQDIYA